VSGSGGGNVRRVLLLDDEPAVLGVLADYLVAPGIEIITCREIEAAEAILEHHRFDVVVTDLRVSELGGLEGIRLIRYVSTHFPETTVLAMSGYVNDDVHALGRAVGAVAVLEKPIDLRRLRRYVHGEQGLPPSDGEGTVSEVDLLDDFLATGAISSVLQPIVDVASAGTSGSGPFVAHGFESLARAPKTTPLRNPEILFAYASRKERLFETDLLCIKAALGEAKKLGMRGAKLFINTQPRSLTSPDFAPVVADLVSAHGFKNSDIVFELTEQQTIVNPKAFSTTLGKLRAQGFQCALDDYGVGFANLRLVQDLRPEYLKLSGYFCRDIHLDPFKQLIVRSTGDMCRLLGIPVILESVETGEELEVVKSLGIAYGQGYYFARPAPADEYAKGERFRWGEANATTPPAAAAAANGASTNGANGTVHASNGASTSSPDAASTSEPAAAAHEKAGAT
jgi:EAL domain-containing protein (putative c-di-GMP-specific phosphodiesterase class I)/ActR/RegA family two-component response regulator